MGSIGSVLRGISAMPVTPANTGLVVGAAAFAWSLRPSLLPRDEGTQSAISLGAFGLGFGVGAGLNTVLRRGIGIATQTNTDAAIVAGERGARLATELAPTAARAAQLITWGRLGVIGVGAGLGLMALPIARRRDFPFANTIESAGRVMLAAGLGSMAVQVHKYGLAKIARTPLQRFALNAAFVGAEVLGLAALLEHQRRTYSKDDPTTPTAKTALVAGGVVGGTYLGLKGTKLLARTLSDAVPAIRNWHVHAGVAALAGAAAVGYMLWKHSGAPQDRPLTLDAPLPGAIGPDPTDPTAGLDEPGIRFLQGTLTREQVAEVTGRADAKAPIRIAVGYHTRPTVDERAQLVLDRMHASGAFDRSMLFLAASPGAGMIDDRLPTSVELFANGDVASVTVPYSDRASFLSLDRIQDGARTWELVLRGIKAENEQRAARGETVPKVVLYGNSLGAWSTQEIFKDGGVAGVEDLVDRVLWVGNPGPSGWRNQVLFPHRGMPTDPLRSHVREYSEVGDIDQLSSEEREQTRIWMHTRASDPVAKVDVDMLWRRPLFLESEHKDDLRMPVNAAYIPGVSFLQEFGDVITTSRIADDPDRQRDGHTYRVDIVPDVAAAYFPEVTDRALVDRVEAAVEAQERELNELRDRQRAGA